MDKIYEKVAKECKLPKKLVKQIYTSYCKLLIEKLSGIPIKDLDEEELEKLKTSVNLPEIGKIYYNKKIKQCIKENQK